MVEVNAYKSKSSNDERPALIVPNWVWDVAQGVFPSAHKNSEAVKKIQTLRYRLCKTVLQHMPEGVKNASRE